MTLQAYSRTYFYGNTSLQPIAGEQALSKDSGFAIYANGAYENSEKNLSQVKIGQTYKVLDDMEKSNTVVYELKSYYKIYT